MPKTTKATLALLATLLAPVLALAEESPPDAGALGTVEAILEYCAKAVPSGAGRLQEQSRLIAQGASETTLAKLRKSEEYQASHDSTLESVARSDAEDAKKACEQYLAQGQ